MKSVPAYTLPPDFNVERLLDDIFPERKDQREQARILAWAHAAEAQGFAGEFSDAVCELCRGWIRSNGSCDCPPVRSVQ